MKNEYTYGTLFHARRVKKLFGHADRLQESSKDKQLSTVGVYGYVRLKVAKQVKIG